MTRPGPPRLATSSGQSCTSSRPGNPPSGCATSERAPSAGPDATGDQPGPAHRGPIRGRRPKSWRRPARRPRPRFIRPVRLRIGTAISLLIHVVLGLLLLVSVRHEQKPEALPPPSAVTMLFDNGNKTGPTLPQPQPDTLAQPAPAPPPVEASPPVQPQPPAAETPAPAAEEPAPPSPEPVPPPSVPPVPAQPVPIPPQPAEPPPEAVPQPPPTSPSPRTLPVKPPANPAPPPKAPNFPPPMNFSLGSPPRSRPQPAPHPPGTIDLSLGPAKQGPADNTPHAAIDGDKAGPDWRNALSLWVSQHAYYPEQARENHEEGEARVHVEATSRGRVTSVELLGKSGSMWLDLALQALFRNANIPPLPAGHSEAIEFNFTMRYILRYR